MLAFVDFFTLCAPPTPVSLWGHDVLQDMEVFLFSLSSLVIHQTCQQSFLPTQGLSKNNQGRKEPLPVIPKEDHFCIGYLT